MLISEMPTVAAWSTVLFFLSKHSDEPSVSINRIKGMSMCKRRTKKKRWGAGLTVEECDMQRAEEIKVSKTENI